MRMEIFDRKIQLCLACMDFHVVYYVLIEGYKFCSYCYRTDSVLQELTNNMNWCDLV